jgi:alanine-synthesizing transaminase
LELSARSRFDLRPNRLAVALAERRLSGAAILDLTETNPTAVGLPEPGWALEALADARGLRYEPSPFGLDAARAAVAADYARKGSPIDPASVVLTASSSEAYSYLFRLACDPGDVVLVPRPSYPLFDYLAALDGVRTVPYDLDYDGEWHLGLGALVSALVPRTRAVVVVNPNNPTGSFLKHDEARVVEAFCAENDLCLISDEVFADFALEGDARRVPSLARDGPALAFCLGGLSKSCGLPQLKLGWIVISGPAHLRRAALERLEVIADTYLSVATPIQVAVPAILARADELRAPIRARVLANLEALRAMLGDAPAVSLLRVEGGWSATLRVPATRAEEAWAEALLAERGVLVHPGYFFDFGHEAFLVVSLLPEPTRFAEGVRRLLAETASA